MTIGPKVPMVSVDHMSWFYEGFDIPAIKDVSFQVYSGEVLGILGPTGSGKTTTCYAMTGLVPHSLMGAMAGTVIIAGMDSQQTPMHDLCLKVGLVFDNPDYQFSQGTVEEEVAFGLENRGVSPDAMPGLITEALGIVGLSGLEKRSPFELSGGQQQRLAISSILVVKPDLLVLDEPTSFLDPEGKNEVYRTMSRLNKEGKTIVIADHEVELMAEICDRLLVLNHGEIFMLGETKDILSKVAELKGIGLRVPQVTEVVEGLRLDDESLPVTVEEGVSYLTGKVKR